MYCIIVLQNQRNTLVFHGVYMYLFPRIWACSRTVSLSESSAPLLPCSPSGWTLKHTQPLLISWWSYSVPVLYNSPRTHSSAAPPTGVPLIFFFLSFEQRDKELASAPCRNDAWHVPALWQLRDPEGDHSNQQITMTNFMAEVKVVAVILHRDQCGLTV